MTSKEKTAFRRTVAWRDFRSSFLREHPTCCICGRKANTVHHVHLNDDEESYCDLNPSRFRALDSRCHRYWHSLHLTSVSKKPPVMDPRAMELIEQLITN